MVINTEELDKYALPAAIGACGALAVSLVVPPLAIVAISAAAYGGIKAYKKFGIPDLSCITGCCKKRLEPRKQDGVSGTRNGGRKNRNLEGKEGK